MEESALYPLKFKPIFAEKVWGGNKIKTLGFDYEQPNCGELWALSSVEGSESVVANGFLADNNLTEVLEIYMGELIGERNYQRFGNQFPILIKLIDSNDRLSIQVHPDDTLAQQRGMEMGKTEMWYILETEPGAEIVDGFQRQVTPEEYQQFLDLGKVESLLHVEHPEPGDMFFIPAGRVHALGKGLLLAEIQQTSDCTYRIYDYNRPGLDGKPRQLHTAEAMAAIDFSELRDGKTHYRYEENKTVNLAECPYFTTNLISLTKPVRKDFSKLDSFVVYLCTEGIAAIKSMGKITPFHAGEAILIPAVAEEVELFSEGPAKLLEVYIDNDRFPDEPLRHADDMDIFANFIGEEDEDLDDPDWVDQLRNMHDN